MPAIPPAVIASRPDPRPAVDRPLSSRNRRTALGLIVWIVLLMLASALVAWLRN